MKPGAVAANAAQVKSVAKTKVIDLVKHFIVLPPY